LNERINETTKRTCFRALRDDITGGQSLRNLSKHRPQLTRLDALKQHLRDELKLSESEVNDIPQCNWAKVKGNRPYSEQRHDRYESEAVRDRLTVFPMASAVKKSWIKRLDYLQFFTAYIVGSFLSTDISWKDIFPVFHEQNNPKTH